MSKSNISSQKYWTERDCFFLYLLNAQNFQRINGINMWTFYRILESPVENANLFTF